MTYDFILFDRPIFNMILIHVARTWERVRLEQPFEEMDYGNLESLEPIEDIANMIMKDNIIQEFIRFRDGDIWLTTEDDMSDWYIEKLAEKMINKDYISNE